jgi:hypothetical protein
MAIACDSRRAMHIGFVCLRALYRRALYRREDNRRHEKLQYNITHGNKGTRPRTCEMQIARRGEQPSAYDFRFDYRFIQ